MGKRQRRIEAERMLELVRLPGMGDRLPRQLSGGQQQRVALARALAVQPAILLLDEPFSALDKSLRLDMQIEIKRLQRQSGVTTIMVTHDQEEALSMSDRVAVLSKGRLEQLAAPTDIYDNPASLFVNTFVGAANVLPGVLLGHEAGHASVRLDAGGVIATRPGRVPIAVGGRVLACLRPEHLRLSPDAAQGEGLTGTVEMALPLGATIVHEIRCGEASVKLSSPRDSGAVPLMPGQIVRLLPASPGLTSIHPHP
jgi:putative spermidine/putrescine transport system ATP-binding protein